MKKTYVQPQTAITALFTESAMLTGSKDLDVKVGDTDATIDGTDARSTERGPWTSDLWGE